MAGFIFVQWMHDLGAFWIPASEGMTHKVRTCVVATVVSGNDILIN